MAGKKKGAPAPRPRSGWVSEDDRNTEQLRIRCAPPFASRAREMAKWHGITLAEVLLWGVQPLEEMADS